MEEEAAHGITHKMARIDIHKDEREAEKVIKQAVAAKPEEVLVEDKYPKSYKSAVFKAITEANKGKRGDAGISFMDVVSRIPEETRLFVTNEVVTDLLMVLDKEGMIHFDTSNNRIYA